MPKFNKVVQSKDTNLAVIISADFDNNWALNVVKNSQQNFSPCRFVQQQNLWRLAVDDKKSPRKSVTIDQIGQLVSHQLVLRSALGLDTSVVVGLYKYGS